MAIDPAPVSEIGYANAATGWWQVGDIEESTPELQWPHAVLVYDAMRRQDAQVASVLRAVTLPVRRTQWWVDPAGARPEVVQLVAEDLGLPIQGQQPEPLPRTRDRFSWGEHLRLSLLRLTYGHMFFEQVYRIDTTGRARLRKLAPRMPRTLSAINVAADGGLDSIVQNPLPGSSGKPVKIPVSRLVAYVNDREGGNWLGTSLLRPAYKHWLIKDRLLRVQAQTIERNGMGIPYYTAGESEKDLQTGLAMAKAWRSGESAGGAGPNGSKMQLLGVEGDLPDATPAIRYHDEQIARAVLAHFLNLGTQTGSWALGTTFADFFVMSLQSVAQDVADVATAHVVEDIVDVNYGATEPAPRIVFEEIGSKQAATAQAIKTLVDAGIVRPDRSLEEATRQHYGLPPKDQPAPTPPEES